MSIIGHIIRANLTYIQRSSQKSCHLGEIMMTLDALTKTRSRTEASIAATYLDLNFKNNYMAMLNLLFKT